MSHLKLTADEIELLSSPLKAGLEVAGELPRPLGSRPEGPEEPAELQRQLAALESLHQEVACRFEDALSTGLQRIVEVRLEQLQLMPYSQFAFSRANPTCFCILQATPLPTSLALDLDPAILYPILDCLLGGGKLPCPPPDRPPTELEQRLAARVTQTLLAELHDVWEPILAVNLTIDRVESNAQRVRLVAPSELVIVLTFTARVAGQSGALALCLPVRGVRKMVDKLLDAEHRGAEGAPTRRDGGGGGPAELAVYLAAKELSPDELLRLQVGSLVLTDAAADSAFEVTIDGQSVFRGRAGAAQGRRAVVLEQPEAVEKDEG